MGSASTGSVVIFLAYCLACRHDTCMKYSELDTPALLVDVDIVSDNILRMQKYADSHSVALRPHTKTHKMPYFAKLQMQAGARGITVAKVGEAEEMARNGLTDIFIANEIVGATKLGRIRRLAEQSVDISFGLDSVAQAQMVEQSFTGAARKAEVLIEVEVGENRSGVVEDSTFSELLAYLHHCRNISFKGVFSHEGHTYGAKDIQECLELTQASHQRTLHFAQMAADAGMPCEVVSVGATPPCIHDFPIDPGITEIRPGTYIFMDVSQGNQIGTYEHCAASILATVISRPTSDRVILDVGAKGLTMQSRTKGLCATKGFGTLLGYDGMTIAGMFDEHAIINDRGFHDSVEVGDTVRILPNHICPVVNLYDQVYLIQGDEVVKAVPVLCRGKLR